MAEELAEGLFRAIFALLRGVLRLFRELLFHIFMEALAEIVGRILSAIFRLVARVTRFILYPVELLYRTLSQRIERAVKPSWLAHSVAIATLLVCGFCFGFGASIAYHASLSSYATVALER